MYEYARYTEGLNGQRSLLEYGTISTVDLGYWLIGSVRKGVMLDIRPCSPDCETGK